MHLHLDLLGGIAGDMFIASLLDAFPEHANGVLAGIEAVPTSPKAVCRLLPADDPVLRGARFEVARQGAIEAPHQHVHTEHPHAHGGPSPHAPSTSPGPHQHQHHAHVPWHALRAQLVAAPLAAGVVRHAIGIFTLLAEAEAEVHGVGVDDVVFHEVGNWDSVADIVGAAYLIDVVGGNGVGGSTRWSASSVPLGRGCVDSAHGLLPIPTPATASLLRGYAFHDDGIGGERVTPTGAAILRYLCGDAPGDGRRPAGRLLRTGHGFGSRRLQGASNCLRVLAFDPVDAASEREAGDTPHHRRLAVVEFEVDDQTPEALALGLDRIRARPGIVDVVQSSVHGKKGRIGAAIRLLVQPEALDDAITACFHETTTIGLRHHVVDSIALYRTTTRVMVDERPVRVKAVQRPGGITAKAESDDLAAHEGHRRRGEVAAAATAAAMSADAAEPTETPR